MNIKKMLTACCVIGTSFLLAQEGNLIPNGSFEEELDKKMWKVPSWVWKQNGPQAKKSFEPVVDATVSHGTGTKSLKFTSTADKTSAYLPMIDGKNIKLPAGMTKGTISMWVKTENFKKKGSDSLARLEFFGSVWNSKDKSKKPIRFALITPWEKSLPEWTQFSQDFDVPEGYDMASLTLKLSASSTFPMTIWADDLYFGPKVEAAAPAPAK